MIKRLVDQIKEELEGAQEYAQTYIMKKVEQDGQWASRYKEMALEELKHASYIHELTVQEIQKMRSVIKAPSEMEERWEKAHKRYVEDEAFIRMIISM